MLSINISELVLTIISFFLLLFLLNKFLYQPVLKFMKERKPFIHATLEDTTPENNVQVKNFIQGLYDNL